MNIKQLLLQSLVNILREQFGRTLPPQEITITPTRKEFDGDLTILAFPISKLTKLNPEKTAEALGVALKQKVAQIKQFNVVKGFLNLELKDDYWIDLFLEEINEKAYGTFPLNGKKVMVEFSSPNTNKPLHLGHLRNIFIGDSLARILSATGHEVCRANLVNDRGVHICKSMLAWELFGNGETPESANMKGDHLVGKYYVVYNDAYVRELNEMIAMGSTKEEAEVTSTLNKQVNEMLRRWEEGDEATLQLWNKMNNWVYDGFDVTYNSLGISFDKVYHESATYLLGKDIVDEGLQKGVFYQKEDGSVWADLKNHKLDDKILLRANGTSVYITQDLGTAALKFQDFGMDMSIYVIGNEQIHHMTLLKTILTILEKPYAAGIFHLSYGMVDLPSGKMKSREGTVVDADELVADMIKTAKEATIALGKSTDLSEPESLHLYQMIGVGALKYYLLRVDPKKGILFSPEESIDLKGQTAPFIQYAHARICSILRRYKSESTNDGPAVGEGALTELRIEERDLIKHLSLYPEILVQASEQLSPSVLAHYLYDLAKIFNRFYHDVPVLIEENLDVKRFRISLCEGSKNVIRNAMTLLGIEVPEVM